MIQKIHVLTAILLIGTCCALFLTGLVKATETKEELEFYNHKNAAITYSYSVKEAADENCWQVQLNRKEIENKTNQRLKIKMTDSENQRSLIQCYRYDCAGRMVGGKRIFFGCCIEYNVQLA